MCILFCRALGKAWPSWFDPQDGQYYRVIALTDKQSLYPKSHSTGPTHMIIQRVVDFCYSQPDLRPLLDASGIKEEDGRLSPDQRPPLAIWWDGHLYTYDGHSCKKDGIELAYKKYGDNRIRHFRFRELPPDRVMDLLEAVFDKKVEPRKSIIWRLFVFFPFLDPV